MGLAMSYLRLPPSVEGESDPGHIARLVFGPKDWRRRQSADHMLDIARSWQGLHYLITGDPWEGRQPESDVVCGGRLLTEDGAGELGVDVIYLAPERVKAAADHLASTPFDRLVARFDLRQMAEAGVQDAKEWARHPATDVRDRLLRPAYESLARFYADAAGHGEAVFKTMG